MARNSEPDAIPVKPHNRRPPTRKPKAAPAPGQFNFSADEERAMRHASPTRGMRQAPPGAMQGAPAPAPDDEDDLEGGI
jgi:hypothetical protein